QQVVAPNFYGDYYPLTPYSLGNDIWTVFQFHRPAEGKGVLVAYRREDCQQNVVTVCLRDLKKDKTYLLTDIDTGETWSMSGKKLMKGFKIKRDKKRDSAIITFEIGD
ncbi:MAG: alpha-galactosidase, partial [Abditibacteriota bacterium]|nr:alpha-galactosidase [Abditibacteriota bacterium]